jgi:hypothetical protein
VLHMVVLVGWAATRAGTRLWAETALVRDVPRPDPARRLRDVRG